jgi:glycosyltransferase involved in cell wall biosynthesis
MKDNFFEIILITYNRLPFLANTLKEIFADSSPIRNLSFTVLDNSCTDGSSELIEKYAKKYSNIKHIRHPKNIGGNGNIVRAFEIAKAKYVWVMCDDDTYDFSAWTEIKDVMETEAYDILLTCKRELKGTNNLARIVRQLTYVYAGIYRTENISNDVLQNAFANISNFFPHLAIVCEVINRDGKIYVCDKELMGKNISLDTTSVEQLFIRGYDTTPHPMTKNMFWMVGLLNSLLMINNKKLRAYIIDNIGRYGFLGFAFANFYKNKEYYNGNELNVYYVWCAINFRQKIEFVAALLLIDIVYFIKKLGYNLKFIASKIYK